MNNTNSAKQLADKAEAQEHLKTANKKAVKKSQETAILDFLNAHGRYAAEAVRALANMALAGKSFGSLSDDDRVDINRYLNHATTPGNSDFTTDAMMAHRQSRAMMLRKIVRPFVADDECYELVIDAVLHFAMDAGVAKVAADYLNNKK